MKDHLYSDRDYLDQQFKSVNERLDKLSAKILGNGEKGLVELTKENRQSLSNAWKVLLIVSVFIFITHLQPATTFILGLLTKVLPL